MICKCEYVDGKVVGLCGAHNIAFTALSDHERDRLGKRYDKALRALVDLWTRRAADQRAHVADGGMWILCAHELDTKLKAVRPMTAS